MASRPLALTALVLALLTLAPAAAGAPSAPAATVGSGTSVADAEAAVEEALADLAAAEADLERARTEQGEVEGTLGDRRSRRDRAATDLRAARAATQTLAVAAYVGGGPMGDAVLLMGSRDLTDAALASTLLVDSAATRHQAAAYFGELRAQADEAVTDSVTRLDGLAARVDDLEAEVAGADDELRRARVALADAEAEAAAAAAPPPAPVPVVAPSGSSSGPWDPIGTLPGGPTPGQWAQLRNCESSGNYQAVSPGGHYRGAYQFDLSTWQTVGGSGDPAAAPPAEQDHRAQLLYASRGAGPWPVCGKYLY